MGRLNLNEEKKLWKQGYEFVIGLDEAGRGCERPDAEVLTNNGWKFYGDIDILKDKVLSYSDTGYIKWQKIDRIVEEEFNGYLTQLSNRGIKIVVTPDHYFSVLRRVFKRDKSDNNKLKLIGYTMRPERKMVGDLDNNDFIPRGGKWVGKIKDKFILPAIDGYKGKEIHIKLWVAFLGIFLSEGSVYHDRKNGSYKITISQVMKSSPEKYKKIHELLKKLPFHFNKFKNGFNCYHKQLYYYLRSLGDKYAKFIPKEIKELKPDMLNVLMEWMLLGDGSYYIGKNRKKVSVYYTASDKLRDDFEEILLKSGWTYHTSKRPLRDRYIGNRLIKKENQKGCFEIRLRRNNKAIAKSLHKKQIFYRGKVFCLQLPKCHNFFIRRGGTGYFTGNSLCGPVVSAAVSITPTISTIAATKKHSNIRRNVGMFLGMRDSKKLSEKQREYFYEKLTGHPQIKWGIGAVSEKVIDKINILQATKLAMENSLKDLKTKINKIEINHKWSYRIDGRKNFKTMEFLLIDGNFGLDVKVPQKSIIKGDEKVFSIAAAGIIAKVSRDRIMRKMNRKYPQYGFDRHKGYGTNLHFENLRKFGICAIHRKSFYPVNGSEFGVDGS